MKKTMFALIVVLGFASCKGPSDPPSATIDGMFTAMKDGNIEGMKKYITRQDVAMLEVAEKFLTQVDPESVGKIKAKMTEELKKRVKDVEYSLSNEKIDGDKATVEAKVSSKDTTMNPEGKTGTHTFELVKEDNTWKIALSKPGNDMFNSMKGNMGPKNGGIKDGLERLQKMDPDSLKMLISRGLKAMDSVNREKKQ